MLYVGCMRCVAVRCLHREYKGVYDKPNHSLKNEKMRKAVVVWAFRGVAWHVAKVGWVTSCFWWGLYA